MWKQTECNCCQTMIFVQNEDDALCDKCEELVSLRIKVERYERALKEIASTPFGDTSCNEIAIKYEVIADKAVYGD
ncbi:hypothetical protein [Neobacillus sp. 19]|uniref:hypothetical protein n=1 Tax=Neobacillus sp. 19 TaxID=3394458 RepID=UPI003BF6EC74